MHFMNKLEKKFGRFGIPNLTKIIIGCYIVGYFLQMFNPQVMGWLSLNVTLILRGQIWRLITWIIAPPSDASVFFFILSIVFFYYPIGEALERTIGTFRYTFYMLNGMLLTIIGAFIAHFVSGGAIDFFASFIYTTYYISLSVFLAFATLYPERQILLWFVIPIRMKWMAIVYLVIMVYTVIRYLMLGNGGGYLRVPIVASLINYGIFYLTNRDLSRFNPREVQRRRKFRQAMRPQGEVHHTAGGGTAITKHKCAICGRTELDDPSLEFRFCSKCNGNYEYCQEHLFTHTHVQ